MITNTHSFNFKTLTLTHEGKNEQILPQALVPRNPPFLTFCLHIYFQ